MKKFTAILVSLLMMLSTAVFAVGCGPKADYYVGVIRFAPFPALAQAGQGFEDKLNELMNANGKTVNIQLTDAATEVANCQTAASNFTGKDLVYAIATPAAQTAANAITKKPVIFTAVTDAAGAGLANLKNVTGVSDINPVAKQIELCKDLAAANNDTAKRNKVGFLYCTKEDNSIYQLNIAKAFVNEYNETHSANQIELIEKGTSDANDITASFNHLAGQVGAIYIPTDNIIANAIDLVKTCNASAKLPIVCGEEGPTETAGVATYSVNYYDMGVRCAEMAFDILVNGKSPKDLPVSDMLDKTKFVLYEDNADEIGYTIPENVRDRLAA